MASPEAIDPISEEVVHLQHFFSSITHKGGSYTDMLMATERLLLDTATCVSVEEAEQFMGMYLPLDGQETPHSPEEYHDLFVTMPLQLLGAHVDAGYTLESLHAWYDKVVAMIKERMRKVHTADCLDSPSFAFNDRCMHSGHCPLIVTAKNLESTLFETDFMWQRYQENPMLAYKNTLAKENIAVKYGLRERVQADAMIGLYKENFDKHFKVNG